MLPTTVTVYGLSFGHQLGDGVAVLFVVIGDALDGPAQRYQLTAQILPAFACTRLRFGPRLEALQIDQRPFVRALADRSTPSWR